ncbi:phosphoribosylanthranilate isomerase [Legionella spiritensis]|uniref:N-(5'-phosphoribosyl)anthranilate isomerase n=1 Tax=Legionella spiritensis TaxID=452 RepID=A0A0W0YXN9_LEGSP|nr:phosphoribosylanthranilate isomerase [Legionella spiritensis]KTD61649.1 N-(5'-phosphoribosyl)anthranilate isomerase [Legionella spiritensis]SNV39157.1 phosphoribosyl anthranilate isomerase [Legionella spiritensis]
MVRVKMCGMTRREDIEYAHRLGVDAVGFIFHQSSPRFVTIERVKSLLASVPVFMDTVAVLVNPDAAFVTRILQELPVSWLQFHGEESPAFCEQFRCPYIKAVPALSSGVINEAMDNYRSATAILIDTPCEARGGSGQPFAWEIIPEQRSKPLMLAGGLDASNVRQAIAACHPEVVDVCSGVELSPGIKSHEKMNLFVQALKDYRSCKGS